MNVPTPYQLEGIKFLAGRTVALLGDDAGLGKSMQMIRAAIQKGYDRILVICPAVGRVSWRIQFDTWDTLSRPVYLFPDELDGPIPDGPVVVIVTMDWLSQAPRAQRFRAALRASQDMDVAFIDEAHGLKNAKAKRTKVIYGNSLNLRDSLLRPRDQRGVLATWAASATFTPLNASELYPHLKALVPDALAKPFGGKLPSLWEFTVRYCHTTETPFGTRILGNNPHTIPELRDIVRPIFLMRLKKDVLTDLPPLWTSLLPLEASRPRSNPSGLTAHQMASLSDDEFLAALRQAAADDPAYATQRKDLGLAKVEAFKPWLIDFLTTDPTRKLIVFAHHRDVIARLIETSTAQGWEPVQMHGGTSAADDVKSVQRFQNDLAVRLFVGQTRSAGTSITLTAASHVVSLEPDPSPLINYQAFSRAHRFGQSLPVTAHLAFVDADPIEKRLAGIIRRRASDFADLFGANVPGATF